MKCLECGIEFAEGTVVQKFCSIRCQRKNQRKRKHISQEERERMYPAREFQCAYCGHRVVIQAGISSDQRTKFCSGQCEKRYWKHPSPRRIPANNRMHTYHSINEYASYERKSNAE